MLELSARGASTGYFSEAGMNRLGVLVTLARRSEYRHRSLIAASTSWRVQAISVM